jgi:ATP-dependent DNA helicase DinG
MRDPNDFGVVMLCDQRLRTRAYGRIFLESLPPMPRTERIEEVEDFLYAKLAAVGIAAQAPRRAAP